VASARVLASAVARRGSGLPARAAETACEALRSGCPAAPARVASVAGLP
jgi:hypothetical protein